MLTEIELREDGSFLAVFEGRRDEWQRIFVFDSDLIQALILNTGPQALIILLHEEKPGSYRGRGGSDEPCC